MKLQEIAGAINYWIAADGKEYRIDEPHVTWAAKRASIPLPTNRDLPEYMAQQDRVYTFMFQRGWMRTSIDFAARHMYVERMTNSRHKEWVWKTSERYHLRALDTEGETICDFRSKQESEEARELMLSLADVDLPGYERHVDHDGTELYVKTLPNGVTVDVFVGTKEAKWDCAISMRDQTGHRVNWTIYPPRTALIAAVSEVEAAASDPATADHAGLELHSKRIRSKYAPGIDETRQLARRTLLSAVGAEGYAKQRLEAIDPKDFIEDQPFFRFYPHANMLIVMHDEGGPILKLSRSIGIIKGWIRDNRESWSIVHGAHNRPQPTDLMGQRFDTKEEAAAALLAHNKSTKPTEPEEVQEAKDPRDYILDDPIREYLNTGRCPVCKDDEWVSKDDKAEDRKPYPLCICYHCKSRWREVYKLVEMPGLTQQEAAPFVEKNLPPPKCPRCQGEVSMSQRQGPRTKDGIIRYVTGCPQPNHTWEEYYQLVDLNIHPPKIREAVGDVRDWMLANAGKMMYIMKAYHPGDPDKPLRCAYDYEFPTFDAAYNSATAKIEDFYVEIEAWEIPADAWPHGNAPVVFHNLWIVQMTGDVKEASPERKAEAEATARGPSE